MGHGQFELDKKQYTTIPTTVPRNPKLRTKNNINNPQHWNYKYISSSIHQTQCNCQTAACEMSGTMEQLKSNQRKKRRYVPLPKIRCVPLPKTKRCVPPSKRRRDVLCNKKKRRRFGPPPERFRCVPLQQGEKTRSFPTRRRCVHLQKTGQEVFFYKKGEDVSMFKQKRGDVFMCKKEQMCSSASKKSKEVFIGQF
jgi:hypothetical protein